MRHDEHETDAHRPTTAEPATREGRSGPAPIGAAGPLAQVAAQVGNAAMGDLVQARLTVGPVDDPAEREADAMAAAVLRALDGEATAGAAGPAAVTATPAPVARRAGPGDEGGTVGPDGGEVDTETTARIARARGTGQGLPGPVRERMERSFGADFGAVRIHTDGESAQLNRKLSAEAFTVGNDIFLGAGRFAPDTREGTELLAHELTHVVQQGGARARRSPAGDAPGETVHRWETGRKRSGAVIGGHRGKGQGQGPSIGGHRATGPSGTAGQAVQETQTPGPESETTEVEHSETGTTTTKERKARAGYSKEGGSTSDVFDGTTHKTSESKHELFAGAEAACKTIARSSPDEIERAVELMARAGVFGESSRKAAIERGPARVGAEGSAGFKAGGETTLKAGVTVSKDLFNALALVMEAGAQVGLEVDLKGKVEAALGPLAASISAQLNAFAGAMAKCKGSLSLGITHLYAEFEAQAFAGAKVEAEGTVSLKLGDAEATASIKGDAMAGAEAEAKGAFKIDLTGVEITGKAEAFAGVKANASGSAALKYKGRTFIEVTGKVGVTAGIGGSAEGSFVFRNGKLKISGELAATLGIGTEVGVGVEIDFGTLAYALEDIIVQAFLTKKVAINRNSPAVERVPIIDQTKAVQMRKAGYEAYVRDFAAYAAKVKKSDATGVTRDRVQAILDKRWHKNTDNWAFLEFDEGVTQAAKDAFGGNLDYIIIQAGQLRAFGAKKTPKQIEAEKKKRAKHGLKF